MLALLGSVLVLIQRYEKAARFNIRLPGASGVYNYRYDATKQDSAHISVDSVIHARFPNLNIAMDSERIDINKCGFYDFEALPGIGPALAENIISYRDSVGKFRSVDDLMNVKGIGPAKLTRIRDMVVAK